MMMTSNKTEDDFDPKCSLVYLNSTAALMETMFKNMKDEDFVYPSKKEVGADDGTVIRCEEHLKRQRECAMQHSFIVPDIYLESVLSKMTDDDFNYGSSTPADPNFGRVVRALEHMELTGTPTETEPVEPVKMEVKPKTWALPQKPVTTVIKTETSVKCQPDVVNQAVKQSEPHDQVRQGRTNKSSGGYNKRQSYKGRVKYDLQTWRNDGCSFANDQGVEVKQNKKTRRHSMNNHSGSSSNNNPHVSNSNTYSYANPTFSPQAGMFNGYGNIGTSYQVNNNGSGMANSAPRARNSTGGYTGFNGNPRTSGDCRIMSGNAQSANVPRMEFWNGGYNDNQQSWR